MPSNRAILHDIETRKLDPRREYIKSGHKGVLTKYVGMVAEQPEGAVESLVASFPEGGSVTTIDVLATHASPVTDVLTEQAVVGLMEHEDAYVLQTLGEVPTEPVTTEQQGIEPTNVVEQLKTDVTAAKRRKKAKEVSSPE